MDKQFRRGSGFCSGIVVLAIVASPVFGGGSAAVYRPDRDTTLYEEGALSNGSGEHLFSGTTALQADRRALLRFDFIKQGTIPPGTKITVVGLTMYCTKSPDGHDTPQTFSLHRVTADWGEAGSDAGDPGGNGAPAETGDATWSERFFGQGMPWAAPGGDFVAASSATATVGGCNAETLNVPFSSPQMIADVQAWVDDPASNFGWILIGNEDDVFTARRFGSGDNSHSPLRPPLFVQWDLDGPDVPATSPAGAALLVLLLATAAAFALRRKPRSGVR